MSDRSFFYFEKVFGNIVESVVEVRVIVWVSECIEIE